MGNEVIDVLDDDGDEDFLSMLDAVEAEALAASRSKRQKLSPARVANNTSPEIIEGPYMAALRGSRSALWQQQQQQQHQGSRPRQNPSSTSSVPNPVANGGGSGGCFKCGESGHWARDCTAAGSGRGQEGFGAGAEDGVPEKACPCGSGSCLVLTSNTTKNPGRKFYRCPLRSENGGCSFFEWCDDPSPGISASRAMPNHNLSSSVLVLQCPCGAGSCLVLVTKTGKNVGQQYYRCPANEGRGYCGFFKWCSEHTSVSNKPTFTSQYNSSNQFSGERNSSSCFKCGQGGHWARDCTNSSEPISTSNRPTYTSQYNPSSQSSGDRNGSSCFKCGQGGHWARDCPNPSSNCSDSGTKHFSSSSQGTCFKCGEAGHWARDCTAQVAATGAGGRKTSKSSSTPFNY